VKAAWAAFTGFTLDSFDIYLPVVALAPAMAFFIPRTLSTGTQALIASYVFVSTLIGRPIGALVFGSLGDLIGRRRSTLIAVCGFGVVTLIMGTLPGYATWGIGAVGVLIALRLLGGILLGGEYSGANVLAMEEAPKQRRGLYGGWIQSGGAVAYILLTAITLGLLALLPATGPHSAYATWGWRIPFVLGGLLAFGFAAYFARHVPESSVWRPRADRRLSVLDLTRGPQLTGFIKVFVMMTGLWLMLDCVTAIAPADLTAQLHLTSSYSTFIVMLIFVAVGLVYVAGASLSQVIGRRAYIVGAAVVSIIGGIPAFAWLVSLQHPSAWSAVAPAMLAGACIAAPWAPVTAYLAERFQTASRSVGYGLGFSLAVILPSFYVSYQHWLSRWMPQRYTVLALIGIGGIMAIAGALLGPETRDVDFTVNQA
jgi:MFS family permease